MNLNPTPGIACGINLKYDFLPKVLKQKGYATWALGKWHLGFLTDQFTPTARGFDTYVGYYSGAEEHFTHEKAGLGLNVYDLTNNSGASLNPLLSMVGNASATYSSYIYGTFFPFFFSFFPFFPRHVHGNFDMILVQLTRVCRPSTVPDLRRALCSTSRPS